jgi:hypothetical protein
MSFSLQARFSCWLAAARGLGHPIGIGAFRSPTAGLAPSRKQQTASPVANQGMDAGIHLLDLAGQVGGEFRVNLRPKLRSGAFEARYNDLDDAGGQAGGKEVAHLFHPQHCGLGVGAVTVGLPATRGLLRIRSSNATSMRGNDKP